MAVLRRFWQRAAVAPVAGGLGVLLDGRPVRTPARALLAVPTAPLADSIAAEWNAVEAEVAPAAMRLTGLANAAIDIVAPDPAAFAAGLARYAESDLLCYRAEAPAPLVERQAARWNPLLDWARTRYDAPFETTRGVMHVAQPPATLARIGEAFAAHGPFELAALSPITTLAGSAIVALAVAEGAIDAQAGWSAALLDEEWQAELWGLDEEAARNREDRRRAYAAAVDFLSLVRA